MKTMFFKDGEFFFRYGEKFIKNNYVELLDNNMGELWEVEYHYSTERDWDIDSDGVGFFTLGWNPPKVVEHESSKKYVRALNPKEIPSLWKLEPSKDWKWSYKGTKFVYSSEMLERKLGAISKIEITPIDVFPLPEGAEISGSE